MSSPIHVLGINAYHGDVSAVLLRDGVLVAAVEEERFRRIKHVAGFPAEAIRACLDMAGVTPQDINHVGVSRNPRAHLLRKALFALKHRPAGALVKDRAANIARLMRFRMRWPRRLGLGWVRHVRRCTGLNTIQHIWRARSSSRRSTMRPCVRSTALAAFRQHVVGRGVGPFDERHSSHVLPALPGLDVPGHHPVSRLHELRR